MKIKNMLKLVDLACNQLVMFTSNFLSEDDYKELRGLARDFQFKIHDFLRSKIETDDESTVIVIERRANKHAIKYRMHYDEYNKLLDQYDPVEAEAYRVDDFFNSITLRMHAPKIDSQILSHEKKAELLKTIRERK